QVLEPAAPAEADGLEVDVHGGQTDDRAVLRDREQDVGTGVGERVAEAGVAARARVAAGTAAGWIEELLEECQDGLLVGGRGAADGHRATTVNASSVTSSTRATRAPSDRRPPPPSPPRWSRTSP